MPRLTAPRQLSSHLFVVYSEFPHRDSGNVFLMTGRVPTLIDCGSRRSVPQLRQNLSHLGIHVRDIAQVIATHGDCDHIQGFHELRYDNPDLKLYLHPADWPLVQKPDAYRNAGYLYRNSFTPIDAEHCVPLAEGSHIPAGDAALGVLHTPGHTEGSVCLSGDIGGRNVVFAGDTVGGAMRSLEGADLRIWAQATRTWEQSLKRLATMDIDWILNGHEPVANLPLSRARFDRAVASFGKMMNPWFLLDEAADEGDPQATGKVLEAR